MTKKKVRNWDFDLDHSLGHYILGLISADGCISRDGKSSYQVSITSIDLNHLIKLKDYLNLHTKLHRPGNNCYRLVICSKRFGQRLRSLGIHPRKSLTLEFPKINKQYLADFVLGYFDGDGTIYITRYQRTKDRRWTQELRSSFCSGSKKMMIQLETVLRLELGFKTKKIIKDDTTYKFGYGTKETLRMMKWMYHPNAILNLERKRKIYEDWQRDTWAHRLMA